MSISSPGRVRVYLSHIVGIFLPGEAVQQFSSYQIKAGDVDDWPEHDLDIVIENGRSQLDRQRANLEAIRSRAQFLLTLTLTFVGVSVASTELVARSPFAQFLWASGTLIAMASALGAGGVIVAKKDLRMVDTRLLSQQRPPIRAVTARALADSVDDGEQTIATEITVFRDAVTIFLIGFIVVCVGWVIALSS